ncbi:Uncharacterised protein [Moraxella lacunata]|uniref:Uncharacterized protein n=2 Tax=Moraxella lacunata TaxID=477 RepID=A0A378TTN5_MORLA|nr:Uncharacterised protein [Moraxella lacunata]
MPDCDGEIMKANEGNSYLKKYGLPLEIGGNFICENGKPKLPKDCQGREFRSEAELRVYWEKHQLPVGLIRFDCSSGTPKVRPQGMKFWQEEEQLMPTCKDSRGRKRPCV